MRLYVSGYSNKSMEILLVRQCASNIFIERGTEVGKLPESTG